MPLISVFLTWLKYKIQLVESWQLSQRFRHRHLRKREFEKLLRQVFGFSKEKAVRWAKYIK